MGTLRRRSSVVTGAILAGALAPALAACGEGSETPGSSASGGTAGATATGDSTSGGAGLGSSGAAGGPGGAAGTNGRGGAGGSAAGGSAGTGASAGTSGRAGTGPLCDVNVAFGEPRPIAELNTSEPARGTRLTSDEPTIVFERSGNIYMAERSTRSAPFGTPTPVFAGASSFGSPWISDDGLVLFVEIANRNIAMARREIVKLPFPEPQTISTGHSDPFV